MRPWHRGLRGLTVIGIVAIAGVTSIAGTPTNRTLTNRFDTKNEFAQVVERDTVEGSPLSYGSSWVGQRAFPRGAVPPAGYPQGIAAARRMREDAGAVRWKELGPLSTPPAGPNNPLSGAAFPVSGRVTSLALDLSSCTPQVCTTIYLGSASGGVWKTTDGGASWRPLTDKQASLSVGAITLDPKNPRIIYVATGESSHSGDSFAGDGIMRSTDGGATWTTLGAQQFVNRSVAALIVDPRTAGNTNATLYAVSTLGISGGGASGGQSARNNPYLPPMGFSVSRNGGITWTMSNPPGAIGGAQDLVMDPNNPDILYAGFNPDLQALPAQPDPYAQAGIYKSNDDGGTWTHLTSGLPTTDYGTIKLGVAPSDSRVLYAAYSITPDSPYSNASGSDSHQAVYTSIDGGATWSLLPNVPNTCGSQCSYDMPLAIDPRDSGVLYLGGSANYDYWQGNAPECASLATLAPVCHSTLVRTDDGGTTWADVSQNGRGAPIHPDDHAIVLNPRNPDVVYTGNDGGIYFSGDRGSSWTDLNHGLGTIQFTSLAIAPKGGIYAGTQDNGTFALHSGTTWEHVAGGDGGFTAADPKTPAVTYNSRFGPYLFRNDFGGTTYIAAFAGDFTQRGLGQFYEPYALAPTRPNVLYFGTYRIWRSQTRGGTDSNDDGDATNDPSDKTDWVPISFDLRCAKQPSDPTAVCNSTSSARGISAVAVSPTNPNVVAVGVSNGRVWITHNALASVKTDRTCAPWKNITDVAMCDYLSGPRWQEIDKGLPGRFVSSITFAPRSTSKLYVTFSGFDQNTPGHSGHVFFSKNGGGRWTSLTGAKGGAQLPNLPMTDLLVNGANGHLYVSGDYGLYASTNGGKIWQRIDRGLPAAPVFGMSIYAPQHELVVATHGRGIWQTPAP